MSEVLVADTEAALSACFPVIEELRPHLSETAFLAQVRRQQAAHGYRLVYLAADDGQVVAVAGYRIAEFLAWGRALYVDDLATLSTARCQGHAGRLLDWLIAEARAQGCAELHLDSGVHRHDAHRLYLGRKLRITSHHFALGLATLTESLGGSLRGVYGEDVHAYLRDERSTWGDR